MIIYLVLLLPAGSSDLPKAWRAAFISLLFGLASNGVYMCHCCYQQCGSLLHCLSTLTIAFAMAVYFCCTGLGVASTGRYPASCPAKPGLSSSVCLSTMQPRPFTLLGSSWFYYMVTLPVFQPFFDFTNCFSGLIRFRSHFSNKIFFFCSNPNQTALFLIFS